MNGHRKTKSARIFVSNPSLPESLPRSEGFWSDENLSQVRAAKLHQYNYQLVSELVTGICTAIPAFRLHVGFSYSGRLLKYPRHDMQIPILWAVVGRSSRRQQPRTLQMCVDTL